MNSPSARLRRLLSRSRVAPWLPWLLAAALLAGVACAWFVVRKAQERRIGDGVGEEVERVSERIARRMASHRQIVGGASKFVSLQAGALTRGQWKEYVESLDLGRIYPGFQAMGYAEWVPTGELAAHVGRLRAEGFPDYEVHPGGPLPPEGGSARSSSSSRSTSGTSGPSRRTCSRRRSGERPWRGPGTPGPPC